MIKVGLTLNYEKENLNLSAEYETHCKPNLDLE